MLHLLILFSIISLVSVIDLTIFYDKFTKASFLFIIFCYLAEAFAVYDSNNKESNKEGKEVLNVKPHNIKGKDLLSNIWWWFKVADFWKKIVICISSEAVAWCKEFFSKFWRRGDFVG